MGYVPAPCLDAPFTMSDFHYHALRKARTDVSLSKIFAVCISSFIEFLLIPWTTFPLVVLLYSIL